MRCYSHLSDDEREQIGLAKAVGHSIGAIAKAIGRPKSTVSRELLRNRLPSGRYSPLHAADRLWQNSVPHSATVKLDSHSVRRKDRALVPALSPNVTWPIDPSPRRHANFGDSDFRAALSQCASPKHSHISVRPRPAENNRVGGKRIVRATEIIQAARLRDSRRNPHWIWRHRGETSAPSQPPGPPAISRNQQR